MLLPPGAFSSCISLHTTCPSIPAHGSQQWLTAIPTFLRQLRPQGLLHYRLHSCLQAVATAQVPLEAWKSLSALHRPRGLLIIGEPLMGCWAQGTDFCLLYQLKSCPLLTVRVPFLLYLGSFKRTVAVFGKVEAVPRFCCRLPVAEQTRGHRSVYCRIFFPR